MKYICKSQYASQKPEECLFQLVGGKLQSSQMHFPENGIPHNLDYLGQLTTTKCAISMGFLIPHYFHKGFKSSCRISVVLNVRCPPTSWADATRCNT